MHSRLTNYRERLKSLFEKTGYTPSAKDLADLAHHVVRLELGPALNYNDARNLQGVAMVHGMLGSELQRACVGNRVLDLCSGRSSFLHQISGLARSVAALDGSAERLGDNPLPHGNKHVVDLTKPDATAGIEPAEMTFNTFGLPFWANTVDAGVTAMANQLALTKAGGVAHISPIVTCIGHNVERIEEDGWSSLSGVQRSYLYLDAGILDYIAGLEGEGLPTEFRQFDRAGVDGFAVKIFNQS